MIEKETYQYWNALSISLPRLRVVVIAQPLREWERLPRKVGAFRVDSRRSWTGYQIGPLEITWPDKP